MDGANFLSPPFLLLAPYSLFRIFLTSSCNSVRILGFSVRSLSTFIKFYWLPFPLSPTRQLIHTIGFNPEFQQSHFDY